MTISPTRRVAPDEDLRVLGPGDVDEALSICDRSPISNVFVAARIRDHGLTPSRLGAQVWAHGEGASASLCYSGANLIPVDAGSAALRAFTTRALRRGRECSSIVGPSDAVRTLWAGLESSWGRPRAVRIRQPLLATTRAPAVEADPAVMRLRAEHADALLPAAVAMYTEEVGVSPLRGGGGALYRARVRDLVARGRAFGRIENGEVIFKAEIGAVSPQVCQLQGVWVPPRLRGRGIGTAGIAAVIAQALVEVAPVVSLYVNDFNRTARRSYDRVGMRQVDELRSVLF